jgi:hypothetical protein
MPTTQKKTLSKFKDVQGVREESNRGMLNVHSCGKEKKKKDERDMDRDCSFPLTLELEKDETSQSNRVPDILNGCDDGAKENDTSKDEKKILDDS